MDNSLRTADVTNGDTSSRFRIGMFLLLCILTFYAADSIRKFERYSFAPADAGWYVWTTISLFDDGDLDLRNQLEFDPEKTQGQVALGARGEWYPSHEFLLSVISLPLYAIFGIDGCLITNILIGLSLVAVLYLLSDHFLSRSETMIATLVVGLTHIAVWVYGYSIDLLATLLVVTTYFAMVKGRFGLAGILFGLVVISRVNYAVLLPAFIFYAVSARAPGSRLRTEPLVLFALGGLPLALVWGSLNWYMYGHPFEMSYFHVWVATGSSGVNLDHRELLSIPGWHELAVVLFDKKQGLFLTAPFVGIGLIFGMRKFFSQYPRDVYFFLLVSLPLIVLFASYSNYINSYGSRYLLPIAALSVLPLGFAVRCALEQKD